MPIVTKEDMFFNPIRDLKAVEPFGFVDLKSALVNGVIEAKIAETNEDYNGIESPNIIIGKPRDIFDALQTKINLANAAADSGSSKESASE